VDGVYGRGTCRSPSDPRSITLARTKSTPLPLHADLEVQHRSHDRVVDRLRCARATGLRYLPCKSKPAEQALARTRTDRRRPAVLDPSALPRQRPRPPANRPRPALPATARPGAQGQLRSSLKCQRLPVRTRRAAPPGHRIRTTTRPPGQPDQPRNPLHKRLSERPADRRLSLRHPLTSTQRRSTSRVLDQLDFNVSDRGCLFIVCCFSLISR
jgi:hypothetical protein